MPTETIGAAQAAALLDSPAGAVRAYALFAHLHVLEEFKAAAYVSQALAGQGIATLRFDFSSLNSRRTSMISWPADWLRANCAVRKSSPATVSAGRRCSAAHTESARCDDRRRSTRARVATSESSLDEIRSSGEATVNLGGRPFLVKRDFPRTWRGRIRRRRWRAAQPL
jgi:putative redox protein